jgi:hypothetical protein
VNMAFPREEHVSTPSPLTLYASLLYIATEESHAPTGENGESPEEIIAPSSTVPLTASAYLDNVRDPAIQSTVPYIPSRAEEYLNDLYDDDTGIFSQTAHVHLQRLVLDSVFESHGNDTSSEISDEAFESPTPVSSPEEIARRLGEGRT